MKTTEGATATGTWAPAPRAWSTTMPTFDDAAKAAVEDVERARSLWAELRQLATRNSYLRTTLMAEVTTMLGQAVGVPQTETPATPPPTEPAAKPTGVNSPLKSQPKATTPVRTPRYAKVSPLSSRTSAAKSMPTAARATTGKATATDKLVSHLRSRPGATLTAAEALAVTGQTEAGVRTLLKRKLGETFVRVGRGRYGLARGV
jgi:hypothetical protein